MEPVRLFFGSSSPGNTFFIGNNDPLFRGINSGMNMEQASKRRPFFSSPEELLDEDYYDEQIPDQKKRRLTADQVHLLEKSFEEENKLEPERKTQLAKKLGLQTRQVAVWFQNRRARWKNKQLEKDYDHLKSSFDFLQSDYDSVLKENERLKAEVMALVEKLQSEEAVAVVEAVSVVKNDDHFKVEDRLSSGSVGSSIVDEDGRQLMDSGDSYFMSEDYHTVGCGAATEEDDGSDDGRNYFSDEIPVMAAVEEETEQGETLNWWVWS
ncbi:homeobox-leucine zipper protein HAT5 [Impatiens glandulifera]|uniref:homeobox-leucine zipper protein HAT5 n=1 Tax=Impatiens glandulifera TaxID=253017 RepID=UPI001FB066BB|nr:homeobox-leucine zipper protein HAT5 [Impatiens glandulifera]